MNLFKCTKYQLIFNMLILCFTFSFICSCGDDDDKEILNNEVVPPSEEDDDSNDDFLDVALPELSAVELSEIDFYGTTISAMIYSDGGDIITERGFCLSSTSKVPTINDQKIIVDSDAYKISALISEFAEVTTYYVRAYAVNSKGVAYSSSVASFVPDVINGYKFVDLGLSVKWATYNVGADTPEETGDLYAWGETSVKNKYTASNYAYIYDTKIGNSYYSLYSLHGPIGGSKYDVAYQKWKYPWSMPTPENFEELINECTWKSVTQNGVKGKKVTGPNGNSIFLPNNDYWSDDNELSGSYGASNSYGYYLSVVDYGEGKRIDDAPVYMGKCVRPVVN